MGWLDSFLHPERGYEAAEKSANQGWNDAQGFQNQFRQQGQDQYGRLNEATGNLLDPEALYNKWASGYQTSPYAKRELEMNRGAGLDAASSMGLMGSSASLANIQQGAGDIVSRDRKEYLDDLMQQYMKGIGLGQDLYGTGAATAGNLGSQAMAHGQNQAELEYGRENSQGKLFENMLRAGAGAGATILGGPIGGAVSSSLFGSGNKYNS